MLLLVSI